MDKIVWTDALSVGNQAIDDDHKKIIDYINKLINYHNSSFVSLNIIDLYEEVIGYSYSHNEFEETILEELGYSELSQIKKEHRNYQEEIKRLIVTSGDVGDKVSLQTLTFLKNWWLDHIQNEDMKYKSFLENKL